MASIADLLGLGSEMEFEGTNYTLRRPELVEQARFSQWLKDRSKAEAGRGDVPDDVREGLYRAAIRDAGELYYEIDSPGYIIALQRPSGFAKLLHIIFETDHPGIDEPTVRRLLEAGLKQKFAEVIAAEIDDPKVLEGVLAVLGFPPGYLNTSGNSSSDSPTPPTAGAPSESAG